MTASDWIRNQKYWIGLQLVFRQGSRQIDWIAAHYPSALDFFRAGKREWAEIPRIKSTEAEALAHLPVQKIEEIFQKCQQQEITLFTPDGPGYPEALRHICGIPAVLYAKGDLTKLNSPLSIAVIGTRRASEKGMEMGRLLAQGLAEQGVVVISGFAKGIDSAAHRGALLAGGQTIAVLATGLDVEYPAGSGELKRQILQSGVLISEYPPGTSVGAYTFPVRNRLLSGLSRGIVIVEAPFGSGVHLTAGHALEQGRDVFAVPWEIDREAGQNAVRLFREGAVPIAGVADILEEYRDIGLGKRAFSQKFIPIGKVAAPPQREGHHMGKRPADRKKEEIENSSVKVPALVQLPPEELEGLQKQIYVFLEKRGINGAYPEEIAEETGGEISQILVSLTELEILGYVQAAAGGRFFLGVSGG